MSSLPKDIDGTAREPLCCQQALGVSCIANPAGLSGHCQKPCLFGGCRCRIGKSDARCQKAEIVLDDRRILGLEGQLSDHQQTLALKIAALDLKLNDFGEAGQRAPECERPPIKPMRKA